MKRLVLFAGAAVALLLLAACGSTSSGGTTTIQGAVLGVMGQPLAGLSVKIGSATATTDATGAFSIAGVTPPYDATVSSAAGNWAHVFVGLSSTTPRLLPVGGASTPTPTLSATIAGTITPAVPPDSTHPVTVCVEGVSIEVFGCDSFSSGTSYSVTAGWLSTANVAVKVHAIQITLDGATALPTAFPGYAVSSGTITLVPGGTYARNLLLATALGDNALSGTVTVPASFTSAGVLLLVRISDDLVIPMAFSAAFTGPSHAYAARVPVIAGATYDVAAVGSSPSGGAFAWRTRLAAGSGRDLALAEIPTPVSPPSTASAGDSFTVGNAGGAPVTVVFSGSGSAPDLAVTSAQATVKLPDALPIPSSSSYQWSPYANPGEDIDQAAGDWLGGYYRVLLTAANGGGGVAEDGGVAVQGSPASFTTP